VTPVENFTSVLRPSAVPAVRISARTSATATQVCTLGRPAVEILVRTSPLFLLRPESSATLKINSESHNYNGTTSAMGEGMATPISYQQTVSATWSPLARDGKAKGGDARGIPPRGRPV
jgi:hypothetical protein